MRIWEEIVLVASMENVTFKSLLEEVFEVARRAHTWEFFFKMKQLLFYMSDENKHYISM